MRHLLVTHRTVPLDRSDEYQEAWLALAACAHALGGHAWLFRRSGHEDHFVEFVEATDRSLFEHETMLAALLALAEVAMGTVEELEEGIL